MKEHAYYVYILASQRNGTLYVGVTRDLVRRITSIAKAWQTVFHLHIHVIPRYEDDPLKLPWVPSPGDPEEIAVTAELLR